MKRKLYATDFVVRVRTSRRPSKTQLRHMESMIARDVDSGAGWHIYSFPNVKHHWVELSKTQPSQEEADTQWKDLTDLVKPRPKLPSLAKEFCKKPRWLPHRWRKPLAIK